MCVPLYLLDAALERPLSADEQQQLVEWELRDRQRAEVLGLTLDNLAAQLEARLDLLKRSHKAIQEVCCQWIWPAMPATNWLAMLWQFWLPLALHLVDLYRQDDRPLLYGILGGQGTGKTTLAKILTLLLKTLGLETLSLSLDDFYLTWADRQALRQRDPRLIWRGPPGTHEVAEAIEIFSRLRWGQVPVAIPRFDKSLQRGAGDRSHWQILTSREKPAIVLLEGWFVGLRPLVATAFEEAPDPIVTDGDRQFARDMNAALAAYEPWWNLLDRLLVLQSEDYRFSSHWRTQAERQRRTTGHSGMTDLEISQFVNYFWKALHPDLFLPALLAQSSQVDWVVTLDKDHQPTKFEKTQLQKNSLV